MTTVLGIDLGTQGLKAVVYDAAQRAVVAVAAAPLEVSRGPDGRAEQDASWWASALEAALASLPDVARRSPSAISVSGQQHGFVPLDAHGEVLAPVKLWCDTATQPEVEQITRDCGGRERCIELTGNPVLAGYTSPKIRWLRNHHPDLYSRLAHILLPHDYLNYLLTGELRMEYGDASGTGLLDVRTRRWSAPMLQAVDPARDLAECLPDLVGPDAIVGRVTPQAAQRFGLPVGIPVAPGGGDNMMAAIGTGNVAPGRLTMSLGTSGTLFAYSDVPVVDPHGNIAAFCSSTGGWLPLLCTMNCTLALELVCRPLGLSASRLDEVISGVRPGADGLVVLPFFTGERTPDLPDERASILGLDPLNCHAGHLLRATVEGATYGLRFGVDELRRLGLATTEIVLTGGGAKSATWRQIVADVCGLPVRLPECEEGAAFGAALQALWLALRESGETVGLGQVVNAHLRDRSEAACFPDPDVASTYHHAYSQYRRAVERLALRH